MGRAVLAFASFLVVAGIPAGQEADETTLLQGLIRHRATQSLQPRRVSRKNAGAATVPNLNNPASVVRWVNTNSDDATDWVATNTEEAETWLDANTEAKENIFESNPEIERIIQVAQQNRERMISCQNFPNELCLKYLPHITKCNRGSDAGYYVRTSETSNVWVIFIEGGGGCASAEECAEWPSGNGNFDRQRTGRYVGRGTAKAGCHQNPHFCTANHVFIPYCSGDLHQGQRDDEHEGLYMSGHLNFKAIIEDLIATTSLGSASRVLLTGVSAGGVGVITNADYLRNKLSEVGNATVKAAPIAGWFMPDRTRDHLEESWMSVSSLANHSADVASDTSEALHFWETQQEWSTAYTGNCGSQVEETEKCQNMPTHAAFVTTPMFVSENMWDTLHLRINEIEPCSPQEWSDEAVSWMEYYADAMQNSTVFWVNQHPGSGLFLPKTFSHGGDVGGGGMTVSAVINGTNYYDALAEWFFDDNPLSSHVHTDDMNDQGRLDHLEGLKSGLLAKDEWISCH